MSIAIILAAVAVAFAVNLVRKRREKRRNEKPVFYVCRQCEHPYAMPNVPLRCRSCGGAVDKPFEN